MILSFFEKTTGLRMNHDYIRPGGVAVDLPDGWEDDVMAIVETIPGRVDEYDEMLTGQPIFKHRTEGVGVISPELAIAMSATGPILRASGVAWDLRRAMPYLAYDEVDFDVIVGTVGDTFDRVRGAAERDPGVVQDRPPMRGENAARGLPGPGQEGDATAEGTHRRVHGGAHPPLQDLHEGLRGTRRPRRRRPSSPPAVSSAATSWRTGRTSRTGCTSGHRAS